ncbi:DUF3891 family protein [Edaphobacter aggregans]|uniref:DUF3891 family protein n=1 Tax=Edaphobacter aggregans TaxID=570835 RepID=UPI0005525ABD
MLLRTFQPRSSLKVDAWDAFAATQEPEHVLGYVSQPAHAKLAGRLATELHPDIFGELPPEVVDAITRHDQGWAQTDLEALETAVVTRPISFLECDSRIAVSAWERSIRQAEKRSELAGSAVTLPLFRHVGTI